MSLVADVRTILKQSGITEDIFLNVLPDKQILIAVRQYGGRGREFGSNLDFDFCQIYVRHTSYEAGYTLIEKIRDTLFDFGEYQSQSYRYLSFYEKTGIIEMPPTQMQKYEFTINYEIVRERIR